METATTHEARARNAKAQALAEILHQHKASVANVRQIPATGWGSWETVATLATERELLGRTKSGKVRQVHVPGYGSGDATATIAAVARILGDLIAAEADRAAIAEQVAPANPHDTEATIPLADMTQDDWDTLAVDDEHYEPPARATPAQLDAIRLSERRPTDSQGYRATVGQLDRETAQSFAMFGGSDR